MRKLIGVLAGVAVLTVAAMVGVRWMNQPIPASFYDTPPPNARKILWIGNSHTRVHQVPYQVQKVLHEAGAQPVVFEFLWKAQTLEEQLEFPEVQEALEKEWDAIILQEQSYQSVGRNPWNTRRAIQAVKEKSDAPVYFYEVWSYSNDKKGWPHSPALAQAHIDRVACWLREDVDRVLPAGRALHEGRAAGLDLVSPDGNHLKLEGALLIARQIAAGLAPEHVEDLVPGWEERCLERDRGIRAMRWGDELAYLPGEFLTDGETTVVLGLRSHEVEEARELLDFYGLTPDVVVQTQPGMVLEPGERKAPFDTLPVHRWEDLSGEGSLGSLSFRTIGTEATRGVVIGEEVALLRYEWVDPPLTLGGMTRADVVALQASLSELGENVDFVGKKRGPRDVEKALRTLELVLEADAEGRETLPDGLPIRTVGYPLER